MKAAETSDRSERSYNQYCSIARAMDILGERWTILIVRDLAIGPKRYKDLLEGLPGIGTNLLAARLRRLEEEGIVNRILLPPPAGVSAYGLTAVGLQLEPVIMGLGRWGHQFLGTPGPGEALLPGPFFLSLRASFRPESASDLTETYEFRVEGRVFEVRVDKGSCTTREGPARSPDATFTIDIEKLFALRSRRLSPKDALAGGAKVDGDPSALHRFVEVFAWPSSSADRPEPATRLPRRAREPRRSRSNPARR